MSSEMQTTQGLPDVDQLQQRPPFRFVTDVITCDDKLIHTQLQLSGEEWFFQGHFPGLPIFPGVLQQEALFQSGALLMMNRAASSEGHGGLGVVTKVEQARFKKMIAPPCRLDMTVELLDQQSNAFYFKGQIKMDGKVITQVHFNCAQVSVTAMV